MSLATACEEPARILGAGCGGGQFWPLAMAVGIDRPEKLEQASLLVDDENVARQRLQGAGCCASDNRPLRSPKR